MYHAEKIQQKMCDRCTAFRQINQFMKWTNFQTLLLAGFLLLSCDNTQKRQIGDTHFFLMEDEQGNGSLLYHNEGSQHPFYAITHEGVVDDVYWDNHYIIVKCSQPESDTIQYWYILNNIEEYDWKMFEVRQFHSALDYNAALDSMGLSEKQMDHTDGTIPWRIQF